MVQKRYIERLPIFKIDTDFPRDSDRVALSIPLFHSPRGWSGNFDEDKNFDVELFKNIVCKGAVWGAHSLMTNTDLCQNGMPIYFHIEDCIFDIAKEILNDFGVPLDWMRKTHFDVQDQDILHTHYGKKMGCFLDTEINTNTVLLWDADAFVYRPLGHPIYEWYSDFDEGGVLSEKIGTSFYSEDNAGDLSYGNWLRLCVSLPEIVDEIITPELLHQSEREVYEKLSLPYPNQQYRYGAAIFSLPRKSELWDFLVEHIEQAYTDEALVSAWMNATKSEFVEFEKLWDMPMIQTPSEFIQHKGGGFAHLSELSENETPIDSFYARFYRGIDGKNRVDIEPANRRKKRIIIFGVPHTPASPKYFFPHCAFSQKARKLATMMYNLGHEVIYFGNELCEVDCTEKVVVTTEADLLEFQPDYKVAPNVHKHGPNHYLYKKFFLNAEHEYRKRSLPDDLICYVLGWHMRPLYEALQGLPIHHIESGIGYYDAYMKFKVFESAAVRDFTYGCYEKNYYAYEQRVHGMTDEEKAKEPVDWNTHVHHSWPQWQDAVIPNSFYPEEFKYNPTPGGDYFLYIGRVMRGKGIEEAMRISDAVGKKLIIAGEGDFEERLGFKPWPCVEIIGPVGVDERAELFYYAALVFCISHYPEPFGGTVIESALSGRPVITSQFGAHFTNVQHLVTGFRMHCFDEGVRFARNYEIIDPSTCREWGLRYSNQNISKLYDEYFDRVLTYANNKDSFYWITDPTIKGLDGCQGF